MRARARSSRSRARQRQYSTSPTSPPDLHERRARFGEELSRAETARARADLARFENEERKLLAAHYNDTISEQLFAEEQKRIRRERLAAEELLRRYEIRHEGILETLDLALELTDNIQAAYLQADATEHRLINQAFFERIDIDDEEVAEDIFSPPLAQLVPAGRAARADGVTRAEAATTGPGNGRTPARLSKDGGSYLTTMLELAGL